MDFYDIEKLNKMGKVFTCIISEHEYGKKKFMERIKMAKFKDKLIFNGNATILFKDGKKYVTKCDASDTYDREKGLLTVLAKANGYNYEAIQEMLKNATIKGKDMQVREVRRRAKVGEYVKIINAKDIDYRNGDILKIIDEDSYVRYGRYLSQFLYDTEYVVLENYKPKEKKENA